MFGHSSCNAQGTLLPRVSSITFGLTKQLADSCHVKTLDVIRRSGSGSLKGTVFRSWRLVIRLSSAVAAAIVGVSMCSRHSRHVTTSSCGSNTACPRHWSTRTRRYRGAAIVTNGARCRLR